MKTFESMRSKVTYTKDQNRPCISAYRQTRLDGWYVLGVDCSLYMAAWCPVFCG